MREWIALVLLAAGAAFAFIACVGVVRMPDLFTRMQATTKAATLGAGLALAATAVQFYEVTVATRVVATIAFLLLTAPVAAHMIGRAAYLMGVPLWEESVLDEMAHLRSSPEDQAGDADAPARNR